MRDADMIAYAKQLRREMTPAEARLWYHLRAKRFGAKFRKQTPIGRCVGDFTCRAAMLVVEVDGDTHAAQTGYDAWRTRKLADKGWRVIRFTNAEVMGNIEGVLATIRSAIFLSPSGEFRVGHASGMASTARGAVNPEMVAERSEIGRGAVRTVSGVPLSLPPSSTAPSLSPEGERESKIIPPSR